MYDLIGIAHPLVDLCIDIDESFLISIGLEKGTMHLVDNDKFIDIHAKVKSKITKIEPGGSVPNTIDGLHLLGCNVAEYAKVGNDKYGEMIIKEKDQKAIGNFITKYDSPTGCVLCLITPDSQRTFVVCLGAASELCEDDIDEKIIKQAKIIHFTGYELESPKVKTAINKIVKIAKKNNILISFDLADPGVIKRNLIEMKSFVKDNVDIIFANEEEAEEFTGKPPEQALNLLSENAKYAIVKLGEKGSLIKTKQGTYDIEPRKVQAKDTTGAGDMYAAGILYGIIKDIDMEKQAGLHHMLQALS